MRAGLPAFVADHIDERLSGLYPYRVVTAIDLERKLDLFSHA
jgi:hypothetical protein